MTPEPAAPVAAALDLVLLDRDGTLNEPAIAGRYVTAPEDARLLPGAGEAVRRLNAAGVPVVVVTNQRGVATGRLTATELQAVHDSLVGQLADCGAHVSGWYVCPHDEGECDCRKPLPGLLAAALADRPGAVAGRCRVIGDAETDMVAGAALGIPGILLAGDSAAGTVAVDVRASLLDAVTGLLGSGV